jgi:flagellar basal-body rod protein FlgB
MDLIPDSIDAMGKAMDVMMAQQRVISANLANVDTPGHKARVLDFEQSLQNTIDGQETPMIIQDSVAPGQSMDGNNVNMEGELSVLSRDKTMYNMTAQLLAAKFSEITTVLDQEQ